MSKITGQHYFAQDGDVFRGLDPARGPWSADHCHAGPVAALTARAAERDMGDGWQIARLTLDLIRPVPVAGIRVTVAPVRQSRSLATLAVTVTGEDGKICVTGQSMHLRPSDQGDLPTPAAPPPPFDTAGTDAFPLSRAHDQPCFLDYFDLRYPPGHGPAPGPKTVWMRFPAIVQGEEPSPFQRLCPIADSGNGISGNATVQQATFLNTDLTIAMHRPPQGAWIASQVRSHWQGTGIGLAEATLFDQTGAVASALQTLMVRRRDPVARDPASR